MNDISAHERVSLTELIGQVADEFLDRLNQGEQPQIEDYAGRHPQIAPVLRQVLPGLLQIRTLKGADSAVDPEAAHSADAPLAGHQPGGSPEGTLGDFRIVREIGRGGMGVVYEAQQNSLSRRVALKVLPFAAVMDPRHLQRFKNEAMAAAQLDHPNIVDVYGVGCDRGVHFYAMRYIEGHTLGELIRELRRIEQKSETRDQARPPEGGHYERSRPDVRSQKSAEGRQDVPAGEARTVLASSPPDRIEPPEADSDPPQTSPLAALTTERSHRSREYFRAVADIGAQVGAALDYGHQHGVTHRDVKPSNLMLDAAGKPWVTDFGLAHIESEASLTMSGDLLGTLRYMSPEQALAKRVVIDHRTDIYSLGATLYEMLTLRPAFPGDDRQDLLRRIAFEEPTPPRKLNPAIPAELETVVLKAIAKNPAERYDTAQELADDLQRFLDDRPIRARRPTLRQRTARWSRRHRGLVNSAAVLLFLLTVGFAAATYLVWQERQRTLAALGGAEHNLQLVREQEKIARENLTLANTEKQRTQDALALVTAEQERAEGNLVLALTALDAVYLDAIGTDKLLSQPASRSKPGSADFSPSARPPLTDIEKELLKRGLRFYDQFAQGNASTPRAAAQTAAAYYRVGLLQTALQDHQAAEAAYRAAIDRYENLNREFPRQVAFVRGIAESYFGLANCARWRPDAEETYRKALESFSAAVALNPKNARLFQQRASVHAALNQYENAGSDHERAIELEPDNANLRLAAAWFFRLVQHPQVRDYDRALRHALKAAELAPNTAQPHVVLATLYEVNFNDLKRAREHIDRALELAPSNSYALRWRARIFKRLGDNERALADFDRSLQLQPTPWAYKDRAGLYVSLEEFEKAFADYDAAEKLDPSNLYVYAERGGTYLALQRYEDALKDLDKALALAPHRSWEHKRRGVALFYLGRYDESLKALKKSLELNPGDLGGLLWIPSETVVECPHEEFKRGLLALATNALERSDDRGQVRRLRIALYISLGEHEKARSDLAVLLTPDNTQHHDHYAHALLSLKRQDVVQYRATCRTMLDRFGKTDDPLSLQFTAWTCALAPKAVADLSPVVALAEEAASKKPDDPFVQNTLGAVLYRAGRFQQAVDALHEADRLLQKPKAGLNSSPADNWYFLAMAYHRLEDRDEAQNWLDKANEWTDRLLQQQESETAGPVVWNRRLTLELLRQEAGGLLARQSQPVAAPKPEGRNSEKPKHDGTTDE
ncbi:MAG: tetratricopeptide repeat protein [Planctomycetes bacterium]|nr:tetratricopeptide repeat protein [Planctomycetota bacterium]